MPKPGNYWGTIKTAVMSASKQKGTPCLAVVFDVDREAGADGWVAMPTAYERTVYLYTSDAAWPHTSPKLESLGFNGDFGNPKFTADGAVLQCTMETYNGKQVERWELYHETSREIPQTDDATIRDMNRRWKAEHAPKTPTPPGAPPAPPPSSGRTQPTGYEMDDPAKEKPPF